MRSILTHRLDVLANTRRIRKFVLDLKAMSFSDSTALKVGERSARARWASGVPGATALALSDARGREAQTATATATRTAIVGGLGARGN